MLLSPIPVTLLPYFHNKGADQTVCTLALGIGHCKLEWIGIVNIFYQIMQLRQKLVETMKMADKRVPSRFFLET